jgi:putative addiction module killer protein
MRGGPKTLEIYRDQDGKEPFTAWLESLKDQRTRYRVVTRLDRVELGNLGDHKMLGTGMFELRMHFGPGYRVYCGEVDDRIVLLLVGGDQRSQSRDIAKARQFWDDYKEGQS